MIRFADILLMYAEVLNELNSTATAAQYVDMVRARAKHSPLATAFPASLLSKDAFRDRLKKERALELCGESVRWADLKRWGDLETQAKRINGKGLTTSKSLLELLYNDSYSLDIIQTEKEKSRASGLRMRHAKERLEILYPDSYTLDVILNNNSFAVSLIVKSNSFDKVHHSRR